MFDPFSAGLRVIFGGPASVEAYYQPKGADPLPQPIRVIRGQPDDTVRFGDGSVIIGTNLFEIQRADVARPGDGDRLVIGTSSFELLGDAVLDTEGLTWRIGGSEL